jgi:nicotinamidase-related amidase
MERLKFQLTSEQLELLLAFEEASGLSELSELMLRDPSVISRNLQRIAETHSVLKKVSGRWQLTHLGISLNEKTRNYLKEQKNLFSTLGKDFLQDSSLLPDDAVLVVINAQKGLLSALEGRNNLEAEKNIAALLEFWRQKKRLLIHIKHVSDRRDSHFFRDSEGSEFLSSLGPLGDEAVFEKRSSSAFQGTTLSEFLTKESASCLVLAGFTASECIDATAKDSAALGISTFVVGDATATFDQRDLSGKFIKADRIHRLTLTHINAFYAKVLKTSEVLT